MEHGNSNQTICDIVRHRKRFVVLRVLSIDLLPVAGGGVVNARINAGLLQCSLQPLRVLGQQAVLMP